MSLAPGVAAVEVTALKRCSRLRARIARSRVTPQAAADMTGQGSHAVLVVRDFLALDAGLVVDVRSPVEFEAGHIPGSVNMPLFTNEQRAAVGTSYKQQGRQPAILLGLDAVGPRLAFLARTALALSAANPGKPLRLTCARGGMRSGSVAWLLGTVGLHVVVLEGGYKAYRGWCSTVALAAPARLLLLSGMTGSGKTEALAALAAAGETVVDIEALTCHRGSSFGSVASGEAQTALADEHGLRKQPRPEQFENDLATALAAAAERVGASGTVWLEDEAQNLGVCFIPLAFYDRMRAAPQLFMVIPTEDRVRQLQADYASASADALCAAAERLRKALGSVPCDEAQALIRGGDTASAARILLAHYDVAYAHKSASNAKVALRLSFKPGASAEQLATALTVAATALDQEVFAACDAVGAAEADARARDAAGKKAAKALRRARQMRKREARLSGSEADGEGALDAVHVAPPRVTCDWQPLLARRHQAFEAALQRAGTALAADPGSAALLDREMDLYLPGAPRDLASASV